MLSGLWHVDRQPRLGYILEMRRGASKRRSGLALAVSGLLVIVCLPAFAQTGAATGGANPPPLRKGTGLPVPRFTTTRRAPADEDESQDAPRFVPGERVQHARFGGGTIADVSGSGRDAKVTVDFDDEAIGRKRLVVAHAGLSRGVD